MAITMLTEPNCYVAEKAADIYFLYNNNQNTEKPHLVSV